MREISPDHNLSAEEFYNSLSHDMQKVVSRIRVEKKAKTRSHPSDKLIDRSKILAPGQRRRLLDFVAGLVDENLFGRAEMCMQFADLLQRGMSYLGIPSRAVVGEAIYYLNGQEIFRWRHAWVRIAEEVVDGNVDCLDDNPMIPSSVNISSYWGPITDTPADRKLREEHGSKPPADTDVLNVWWPELQNWLDNEFRNKNV